MRILLSNDDGVHAEGLRVLYQSLKKIADVTVVAPLEEKSTTGHSLTLHKPLRLLEIREDFYGVSGSPADCVYMGIRKVMRKKPDWVISGINRGANLGQDVYYSGTVSAAREACMMGIRAISVSLAVNFKKKRTLHEVLNYSSAAKYVRKVLKIFDTLELPKHTLLNLNVPDKSSASIKGLVPARQGFRVYDGSIVQRHDHRGRPYYWIGGQYRGFREEQGTDCAWVNKDYAALTPIQLDGTSLGYLGSLRAMVKGKKNILCE